MSEVRKSLSAGALALLAIACCLGLPLLVAAGAAAFVWGGAAVGALVLVVAAALLLMRRRAQEGCRQSEAGRLPVVGERRREEVVHR